MSHQRAIATKITYGRKRTTGPLRRCGARARAHGRTQHQQMECKWIFLFVRPCTVNQRRSSSFVYRSSRFTLPRIVHADSAYMPLSHQTNDQRVYSWLCDEGSVSVCVRTGCAEYVGREWVEALQMADLLLAIGRDFDSEDTHLVECGEFGRTNVDQKKTIFQSLSTTRS